MANLFFPASSRGSADHGWLKAKHSFSFASWHDPSKIHFGALRVLNDDQVAPGMGFGTHPHDNMEIITIVMEGELEHQDSMGNKASILPGEIQVMSAGTGITHSEKNKLKDQWLKLFQIWLFPKVQNVTPRYDQVTLNAADRHNKFQQVLSPNPDDEGVWIHQDAWFHLGSLDAGTSVNYDLKRKGNGVYVFVIDGTVTLNDQTLNSRDALGITGEDAFTVTAVSAAEVLLMEVPMQIS